LRFYIHDWTGGYRAVKKEVFLKERKKLQAIQGYTFQISFLHRAVQDGFKVAEVPFNFVDRTKGNSKIPSRETIVASLKYVFVERAKELTHSPFLKYAITGFLGYLINAISLELFFRQGMHPALAGAIGAELAIIWNFFVNNFWAFNKYKITHPLKVLKKFPQFNLISLGSLVIVTTVLFIGTHLFGEHTRQLFLIIAIGFFVLPYSYSMYNIFIWKRWHIPCLAKLPELAGSLRKIFLFRLSSY
jgi:dolichol-phosphate mannosyltransferase